MSLSRFAIANCFRAWSPADRNRPERQVSIAPGPKDLFTDETYPAGMFIKFLHHGSWFEANRDEFARCTVPLCEECLIARHGA
jgi:hypothetical protein